MALSTLLAANLLLQTSSVPIWVPLAILLLIILLFWWGLTRNRIPEESAVAPEPESHEEVTADMEEEVDVQPSPAPAVEEEAAEEQALVIEDEDRTPAVVEAEKPPEADDLKIIEGIGPKIAGILASAGISTFAQLANTDPEQLDQIVREDAGIKIANPASWPEQAALAASGDLDGLEELQNRLVAGRHRS